MTVHRHFSLILISCTSLFEISSETKGTGIWIDETLSGKLIVSGQIKDAAYGVQMLAGIGDFPVEDWGQNATLSVEGINCMEAVSGLTPENLSLDVTKADFFWIADSGCIVSDALMEQNRWEIGEEISGTDRGKSNGG